MRAVFTTTTASAQQTLEAIKARGQLVCGIGTGVAGFGLPDSKGVWQGMDVDLCRGLAAAIFNDPNKVRFSPLSSSTRFTALGAGEVDVLFRTSTQTMLRDVTLGLRHVVTYFYDGHGFIVKKDSVAKVAEMRDATICLVQGTTNEQVTADYFRSINTPFKPVLYERTDQATRGAAGRPLRQLRHRCVAARRREVDHGESEGLDHPAGALQQGALRRLYPPRRPAMVRRGALVHHRADRGGGAGRHPRQCRGDARDQRQPEYPPPAGRDAGAGRGAEARPQLGLQRGEGDGNYGEIYDRPSGRTRRSTWHAARTGSGPRAG